MPKEKKNNNLVYCGIIQLLYSEKDIQSVKLIILLEIQIQYFVKDSSNIHLNN